MIINDQYLFSGFEFISADAFSNFDLDLSTSHIAKSQTKKVGLNSMPFPLAKS